MALNWYWGLNSSRKPRFVIHAIMRDRVGTGSTEAHRTLVFVFFLISLFKLDRLLKHICLSNIFIYKLY